MPQTPRPAYHLTPSRHWMNDPNGLIHHAGRWHAFFQHDPVGGGLADLGWGHASSTDLVHWSEHPVAIPATADELAFSGSSVHDRDGSLVAVYTRVDRATGVQAQALARSRDGGLTFERYPGNPVLDRGSTQFRDPKVFRHDGGWVMVTVEADQGRVLLHRSEDLVTWTYLSDAAPPVPADAPATAPHPAPALWECPDLFALTDDRGTEHWILLVSLNPGGMRWWAGNFDGTTFTPQPGAGGVLDAGPDFYAGATFADAPDGRRILLAWTGNWDYARDVPTEPFRGQLSLPRELALRSVDGVPQLVQAPAREVAAYGRHLSAPARDGVVLHVDAERGVELTWAGGVLTLERAGRAFHPRFARTVTAPVPASEGRVEVTLFDDTCSVEVLADGGRVSLSALALPE